MLAVTKEDADLRLIYLAAALFVVLGLLFAFNVKGISEKFFRFVTKYTPAGNATPNTMRYVSGGWVFLGIVLCLPEIVSALR
ncbi:hypothetical protein OG988_09185 [Streptomyces zaomyceticus]|uniref:hypothetical protein n=1 Tax=Streptomyces zaomyceticus TaxID=68286 RepID=UPI0032548945